MSAARQRILTAAMYGLTAWIAYGVVEIFFLTLLPGMIKPSSNFTVPHSAFTALLLVLYAAAGAILGAAAGWAFPRLNEARLQAVATATVLVAYTGMLLVYLPERPTARLGLCAAPLLLVAVALSARQGWPGTLFRCFRNPWIASLLTLGPAWIAVDPLDERPLWLTGAAIVCSALVVASIATWILRRADRTPGSGPIRKGVAMAALAAAAWIAGAAVRPQALLVEQRLGQAPAGKPHVILITLDTVRADHMSLYGYERDTTPELKKFAREAALYTNAFSSGDMTLSTHGSLFTGLYPQRHGAHFSEKYPGGRPLAASHFTLAEMLTSGGYITAAVVANPGFLSQSYGLAQGFGRYDHRAAAPLLGRAQSYSMRQSVRKLVALFSVPREYDQIARRAGEINEEVYGELERMKTSGHPMFLFVNYMDAHWPYIPPAPFHRMFPGLDESFTLERYFKLMDEVLYREGSLAPADLRHLTSQYDGGIAYLDAELGRLMARLREMGLYDRSLIVITSDHGEAFGERKLMEHGSSVYQDQVHIPLLVKFPRESRGEALHGSRRTEPVNSVDLMPTALEAAGLTIPENLDGASLLSIGLESRPVYSESYPRGSLLRYAKFRRSERSVVSKNWKLISSTAGKCELYDLAADPSETRNLCRADDAVSRELARMLKTWSRQAAAAQNTPVKPDAQTMEMLRSLGYVQ